MAHALNVHTFDVSEVGSGRAVVRPKMAQGICRNNKMKTATRSEVWRCETSRWLAAAPALGKCTCPRASFVIASITHNTGLPIFLHDTKSDPRRARRVISFLQSHTLCSANLPARTTSLDRTYLVESRVFRRQQTPYRWLPLAARPPPLGPRNGSSTSDISRTTWSLKSWRTLATRCAMSSSG